MTVVMETRRDLGMGLLVAAVAFFVYANSLNNGFALDDASVFVKNPALQGSPLDLFRRNDTTNETQLLPFYRPLTYLTYYTERIVHGFDPFYVRLFNVLLHAANAFLVYFLARTLIPDPPAALLAALLFAVHPLQAEGVDFNSGGRNTMLACFFSLTAYLCHKGSISRNSTLMAIAGAVLFLAGLLSKELTIALLPFIAVLEYQTSRGPRDGTIARLPTGIVLRGIPYIIATGSYLYMRWLTLSPLGVQAGILPGMGDQLLQDLYVVPDLFERLLDNVYIIPRYLLTVIWPVALSSRYIVPEDLNLLALPLAAAWLCIAGMLIWLLTRGRSRAILFGLGWFAAFWFPVSGVVYFSMITMADRYLYVPAIGLWLIIADRTATLLSAANPGRRKAAAIGMLVLILLAGLTIRRDMDWKNDFALYSRMVEQYPENPYGHAGLGNALYAERASGKAFLDQAEAELEKALSLSSLPGVFLLVHEQLGQIKQERGAYAEALRHYNDALAIYPYDWEARINRAIVYERLGRPTEALSDYRFYLSMPQRDDAADARRYAETRIRALSHE